MKAERSDLDDILADWTGTAEYTRIMHAALRPTITMMRERGEAHALTCWAHFVAVAECEIARLFALDGEPAPPVLIRIFLRVLMRQAMKTLTGAPA